MREPMAVPRGYEAGIHAAARAAFDGRLLTSRGCAGQMDSPSARPSLDSVETSPGRSHGPGAGMPFGMVLQDGLEKSVSFRSEVWIWPARLIGHKFGNFVPSPAMVRMPYCVLTVPAERPQSLYMYMHLSTCTDVDAMCRCTGISMWRAHVANAFAATHARADQVQESTRSGCQSGRKSTPVE
jgi:hypothetical protein